MEQNQTQFPDELWIALSIGNSRLHWAWFLGESLQETWETPHRTGTKVNPSNGSLDWDLPPGLSVHWAQTSNPLPEIWIVSVVPEQTAFWQSYPGAKIITLDQIPLQVTYPTLGVDRALAIWGAGEKWGWPILVIDAGTALTFTGADANGRLVGGAILPGLGLQVRSLAQFTATLPLVELTSQLPSQWATSTPEAVQSGIVYTVLAGIRDFVQAWCQEFPESQIVLTGGDHLTLLNYLQARSAQTLSAPDWLPQIINDPHLLFSGIQSLRQQLEAR
jgi:type III pantothenate kinase